MNTSSNEITIASFSSVNPVAVYLASLAPGSRRTMLQSLNALALLATNGKQDAIAFHWHLLRYQHTTALRSLLAEKYAPATCNKILAALRRVLRESERLGLMTPEDYSKASDIKRVQGNAPLKGRALSGEELTKLNDACAGNNTRDIRDAAILAVLRIGLRRQEVVSLRVDQLTDGWLTVRGKGRKLREVPLRECDISLLQAWLKVRGDAAGELFQPISKSGNTIHRKLSPDAIRYIVQHRGKELEYFTPHDFRRTFAGDLFDKGADTSTVQQLLGHSDPATTTKYDRRGNQTRQRVVNLI